MSTVPIPDALRETIQKYQQEHLLENWDQLEHDSRQQLLHSVQEIDFPNVARLIDRAINNSAANNSLSITQRISPLQQVVRLPQNESEKEALQQAKQQGQAILDAGKVGAILVAGGQGSRLGFPHPKGMYPIGPVTDRSLFQIFFEQLVSLSNRHNVSIPYFIMTSDATHDETEQFFTEHNWFGYPSEDVFLFRQGKLPAVDSQTGKILLTNQSEIAMSPDGHGGLLQALKKAGLIEQMQQRGIEHLFYHQVDNPSVRLCDPVMLGFHHQHESEMSTKVVAKRTPIEKVGIVAELDGVQQIIEYSDLDEELASQRDEDGHLVYWAGNIAVHIFNRTLLEKLTQAGESLPIHIAHKKVDNLNEKQESVTPEEPNAYKFEQFIFDAIPKAKNPLVIEVDRAEEFNPVKNATGDDSPETSRTALIEQAKSWLQQAGCDTHPEAAIEISPLVALDAVEFAGLNLQIQPDETEILINPELNEDAG